MTSLTTVSLPQHLRSKLEPLPDILTEDLRLRLSPYLAESISEIPHSILSDISKWARTEEARSQLRARHLEPSDYSIISLLAGTITSPSSKLPPYIPPEDAAQVAKRTTNDRQAITTIMNALLSIGGSGYAGWWSSGRTGWRDEWRVLFALLVAAVVAISEALLYLIWQSRRDGSRRRRAQFKTEKRRKEDSGDEDGGDEQIAFDGLRKRKPRAMED